MLTRIKNLFLVGLLFYLAISCKSKIYRVPEVKVTRTFPVPFGMAYIPSGEINFINPFHDTSTTSKEPRKTFKVTGFFIDITEVSNKQYRQFVDWVADSIAITDYLNDPRYFFRIKRNGKYLEEDKFPKRIDWSLITGNEPLWSTRGDYIQSRLHGLVSVEDGKFVLNQKLLVFKYKKQFIDEKGREITVDKSIAVYPDINVWAKDMPNAQNDLLNKEYFRSTGFDDYPVVGVTWEQANAYAHWRGLFGHPFTSGKLWANYSLPTEVQYRYAALKGMDQDEIDMIQMNKSRALKKFVLGANFKQDEGEYSKDGGTYTVPVKSYRANTYGVYNLFGNVAEWALDNYSSSALDIVADFNPLLLYEPKQGDGDAMKRKLITGGSWMDPANNLNPFDRHYRDMYSSYSTVGFRCVLPASEIITKPLKAGTKR